MEMPSPLRLVEVFEGIQDWRGRKQTRHKLAEILAVAISAMISGADDFEAIAQWGKLKLEWLRTFMPLENGIPSADTFLRVFSILNSKEYERTFRELAKQYVPAFQKDQVVAIDGKTSRRSTNKADASPLHLVSAFAADLQLVLGQTATAEKSNEITAIPELLDVLDLKNCIVTIDAMGTQKKIAQTIRSKEADYVLCVKDNHPKLAESILKVHANKKIKPSTKFEKSEKNRNRFEERRCWAYSNIDKLNGYEAWADLSSFAIVERRRTTSDGKTSCEQHLYISSLPADATRLANSIRKHWQIENGLHWRLDVQFADDDSRARTDNAANNLAITRHIALNLLRLYEMPKTSIKTKRLLVASSDELRAQVLRL